jgi:bacterioferritin
MGGKGQTELTQQLGLLIPNFRGGAIHPFLPFEAHAMLNMNDSHMNSTVLEQEKVTREEMVRLLNEDLAREYQAIIAYVVYSQVLKGAAYMKIAKELEKHAAEELVHALKISKQIDYFGGMPGVAPKKVMTSEDPKRMLQFDLENEKETIRNYLQRIQQADAMGEFALSEVLREIVVQEQEHLIDLATALGIQSPEID